MIHRKWKQSLYLSGAGLFVESVTFVTSSSELLRFLQTIGIARAHEPSQIKLKGMQLQLSSLFSQLNQIQPC